MNFTPIIAPMFPDDEPTENSSLEELTTYALNKQKGIFARDKKNAEDLWLMGQALAWAKPKVGHGKWEKWWKVKGFKKTYVWQARKLHENAATLGEVKKLGLTEALLKFGVVAQKKEKAGTTAASEKKAKDEPKGKAPSASKEAEGPTVQDEDCDEPDPDEEPTEQVEDCDEAGSDQQPNDHLADEEEREFKEFEASIRKMTPKARAVAIHHALELLRDELDKDEVDQELQQTLGQIAQLAEAMKGVSQHVETA